ncbi:putative cation efflux family protein [Lyophyllum shimeji]|uniref:Cation efflux family protein n=1 Tax=Lyophyllum shimeji TaxID=47721 RepID=A0A9P3UP20_LYOSH|nr:putative cation efflux family protein [Lyophyllum shimeji]
MRPTTNSYAVAISVASVIYNGAEGAVSIGLGADAGSRSLVFFGIQSGIEVLSAILVLWRFRKIAKPGEERSLVLAPDQLKFEKWGTLGIGILLLVLAIATEATSISALARRDIPDSSTSSLIVSSTALVFMILIWLPKRYLAKALDSSVMRGEAICSLSCIQLTLVLFIGSLVFKVWKGGWWVDSATAIALGLFFAWDGVKMVRNSIVCTIKLLQANILAKDSGSACLADFGLTSVSDGNIIFCDDILVVGNFRKRHNQMASLRDLGHPSSVEEVYKKLVK